MAKVTRRGKRSNSSIESGVLTDSMDGFSSGYGMIDYISGVPGILFPRGTIVELFGLKSSSKTTIILETIAWNQLINPDFKVLYLDFERMLRKEFSYLNKLGIDTSPERFSCETPVTMEEGINSVLEKVRENSFDFIVIDTVAAMRPKVELEKGFANNKQMGVKGKLMAEFMRNLMADLSSDGPAVVFINQLYKDVNNSSFIQMYESPSSDSLKFFAGIRIEVRQSEKIKAKIENPYTFEIDERPVGNIISIKTEKNKVGMPYLKTKYMITYGYGIDIVPSFIAAAIRKGAIKTKGNSKSAFVLDVNGEEKSITGVARLTKFLRENVDLMEKIATDLSPLWEQDIKNFKRRMEIKSAEGDIEFSDDEGEEAVTDNFTLDEINVPSDTEVSLSLDINEDAKSNKQPTEVPVVKVEKEVLEDKKSFKMSLKL